ncbi:MAG: cytochrome c3 family protein [Candidatus Tectomicrobia bacterium]|uniref:Cytochrome c3 family protein n=1 Tax=Tectimicrobiota bacterium TaxID=2528274 RepID=A0A932CRB4_UNCTE|nr:cytochrome c3 family protein [Candidatus Tectomicrobia bacterium]
MALGMILLATCTLRRQAAAPIQPIAFSHKTHAGTYGIPCLYCHVYARRSTVAGVPSVQACFNCHKVIGLDQPEVLKVLNHWNKKEPIPWIKVHDLPDFVYFSHKRHVLKGVVCQTCHGTVQRMERVRRVSSLEMGWCVDCHIERGASRDCPVCHK